MITRLSEHRNPASEKDPCPAGGYLTRSTNLAKRVRAWARRQPRIVVSQSQGLHARRAIIASYAVLQGGMTDPFVAARKRQLVRLGGAKPPAPRAAMALAKSQAYQDAADAPTTLRAYATDLANYKAWCERHGFDPMPATPEIVGAYLAAAGEGYALPTLRRRVAAIYSATVQMAGQRQQACPVAACEEDGVTDAARQVSCCTARHVDDAVMTSLCLVSRLLSLAARRFCRAAAER
jgi:hypothetical protein